MNEIVETPKARLTLPGNLGTTEMVFDVGDPVSFQIDSVVVQRNDDPTESMLAFGLRLTQSQGIFACLVLDLPSARKMAEAILNIAPQEP